MALGVANDSAFDGFVWQILASRDCLFASYAQRILSREVDLGCSGRDRFRRYLAIGARVRLGPLFHPKQPFVVLAGWSCPIAVVYAVT